jgi:hypothetical protein
MHCNMKLSFDYLVGAGLQRRRQSEKKPPRGGLSEIRSGVLMRLREKPRPSAFCASRADPMHQGRWRSVRRVRIQHFYAETLSARRCRRHGIHVPTAVAQEQSSRSSAPAVPDRHRQRGPIISSLEYWPAHPRAAFLSRRARRLRSK